MIYRPYNFVVPLLVFLLLLFWLIFSPSSAERLTGGLERITYGILGKESALSKNIEAYRALFKNKEALLKENEKIKQKLIPEGLLSKQIEGLEKENERLKALLGRKGGRALTLASVISKPNRSPYDTVIIDIGQDHNISLGSRVFVFGDILIGSVEKVYEKTALVSLFSTSGNEFETRIGEGWTPVIVSGRGGGSFEATVPRALGIKEGDEVIVPSLNRTVIGYVASVIADPRDPLEKVFITSPVSLYSLGEVGVEMK